MVNQLELRGILEGTSSKYCVSMYNDVKIGEL